MLSKFPNYKKNYWTLTRININKNLSEQTRFLSSESIQQIRLPSSVEADHRNWYKLVFNLAELVKCSWINCHLITMKVLYKAEWLWPSITLQISYTYITNAAAATTTTTFKASMWNVCKNAVINFLKGVASNEDHLIRPLTWTPFEFRTHWPPTPLIIIIIVIVSLPS